ncbi:MAG: PAS domain S-box protein [Desulfonatronovibrio sp.]
MPSKQTPPDFGHEFTSQETQDLVQKAPIGIFTSTHEGRFITVNPALAQMLGYDSPQDMISCVTDIATQFYADPKDREKLQSQIEMQGQVMNFECRFLRRDGSSFWASTNELGVRDENVGITHYQGFITDISERRQYKEELQQRKLELDEQEKLYRSLIEDHPYFVERYLPDTTIVFVNKALAEYFGYTPEQLEGRKWIDFVPEEEHKQILEHLAGFTSDNSIQSNENSFLASDGMQRWCAWTNRAFFDDQGQLSYFQSVGSDITEPRQAEQALRDNEEQFRAMFEKHHAVMLLIEPENGKIIHANQSAEKYYGYTAAEFENLTIQQINQSTKEEIASEMANAKALKRNYFYFPHKLATGEIRDVEVHTSPIPFKGKIILFSIIHDITVQKQAELALAKRQKIMAQAEELTDLGSWEWDIKSDTWLMTENIKKIHGVHRTHLKTSQLLPIAYHEDRPAIEEAFAMALDKGEPYNIEHRIVRQDTGEVRYVHAKGVVELDDSGKPEVLLGATQDITERKLTEQKLANERSFLSTVLDNIQEAIVVCDKEGRLVRFNEAARRLHGVSEKSIPPEQWATYYDLFQPDGITPLEAQEIPLYRALQGEYLKNVEIVVAPKHEGQRFFSCSGQPLIEAGEINGAVVMMADITERKQLEQLKEDVERITRHDLKAPLDGIIGLPQLLLSEETLNKEQKELIGHIQHAGNRMLNMINTSLSLYQMEKGEYKFCPGSIDLVPIIQDIQKDLSKLCSSYQNNISVFLAGSKDITTFVVSGEKLLCYTMLSNLIKNAVESTPQGERVHIQLEEAEPNQAKITIHNPGMIPEQIQEKLGQKYVTCGKKKGTGLGVYSVRLTVRTMNGSLNWSSSKESGTFFIVYLPMPEQSMRKWAKNIS